MATGAFNPHFQRHFTATSRQGKEGGLLHGLSILIFRGISLQPTRGRVIPPPPSTLSILIFRGISLQPTLLFSANQIPPTRFQSSFSEAFHCNWC